jgi:hypothetical protein
LAVSPDKAWSVAGPTPPPAPPTSCVADPLSDKMKAGRWNPQASDAQKELVDSFKKEHNMK